jgi:hypothetical protein
MAPRHAFTFQLADSLLRQRSPGHAATVISTPQQQTYSGLGPAFHDWYHLKGLISPPSFNPQIVLREETPPRSSEPHNYSTASSDSPYATYTVPITEDQANQALAQIRRTSHSGDWYNALDQEYCTTDVNRNARAAGLGTVLPYELPGRNRDYLADVERTLRANPRAKYLMNERGGLIVDSTGRPTPIPEALREIQRDYAFVGGGYDTPSERSGHVPTRSGPRVWESGTSPVEFVEPDADRESSTAKAIRKLVRRTEYQLRSPEISESQHAYSPDSVDERFGRWTSLPSGSIPRNPNLPAPAESNRPLGLVSGKPMPLWITPPPIWGDRGNSTASGDSNVRGETIEDWLSGLPRPRSVR